mgnify:CR=1 FL=1
MQEQKFLYKDMMRYLVIVTIFLAVFSVCMFYKAIHNTRMLSINYGTPFSVEATTDIYFFVTFLITSFMFMCVYGIKQARGREKTQRYITLNDSGISLPKSMLSNEIVTISYSDIKNIAINSYNKKPMLLSINYNGGQVGIHKSVVSKNDFKQIYDTLVHMIKSRSQGNI